MLKTSPKATPLQWCRWVTFLWVPCLNMRSKDAKSADLEEKLHTPCHVDY